MSQLSPKARALLARTSSKYEPSAADRDRLRRTLHARVGFGVAAGATGLARPLAAKAAALPATALPSATAGGAAVGVAAHAGVGMIVAKTLAMVVLVGSVATTTVVLTRSSEPGAWPPASANPQAKEVREPAPPRGPPGAPPVEEAPTAPIVAVASLPPAPSAVVTVASLPPARSTVRHAPPAPPAPANTDPLDAELTLLRDAHIALRSHEGARALDALDALDRRFPNGLLAEERAAAQVFALCELGRADEAARAKSLFLAAHPVSPQAERVRHSCGRAPGQ